jgi:hypothetical protein
MNKGSLLRCISATAVVAATLLPCTASAQAVPDFFRIRRLEATVTRAPQYSVRGPQASQRQRQWLEVTTEYQISREAPPWMNEVTFTYYIALRNRNPAEGDRPINVFRGESVYVNVAQNINSKSAVYLHPSTLERYGEFERAAVVVSLQGRMIAIAHTPETAAREGRWWETVTPQTGLVLPRSHTPFAMVNFDDYEASPLPQR